MRWKIAFLILGATAAAIAFNVFLSFDRKNYFFYGTEDQSLWTHPTGHMVMVCSAMLAEGLFTGAVLLAKRPTRLWARCLAGMAFLAPWAAYSSLAVIHMPMYVLVHHLWAWMLVASLAIIALASFVAASFRESTRGKPA